MTHRITAIAAIPLLALGLAACAPAPSDAGNPVGAALGTDPDAHAEPARLGILADDRLLVLDADTLDTVAVLPAGDVDRLADLGGGRLALVREDGIQVADLGLRAEDHGDHAHVRTTTPALGARVASDQPTHIVAHAGSIAVFGDGDGAAAVFPAEQAGAAAIDARRLGASGAHHGVAVPLPDGGLLITEPGAGLPGVIRVLDATGTERERTEVCPALHGETAAGDAIAFGCAGAIAVYDNGAFRAVALPDAAARVGSLAAVSGSPLVVGDFSLPEQPRTRLSVLDLRDDSIRVVPLGAEFASILRTADGGAAVLGTDGAVHLIDLETGETTARVAAIGAWSLPQGHGASSPQLVLAGGRVIVTDPRDGSVIRIDPADGSVAARTVVDDLEAAAAPTL